MVEVRQPQGDREGTRQRIGGNGEHETGDHRGEHGNRVSQLGRKTLDEVAAETGLSAEQILTALNLPVDARRDVQFRELRRSYRFDMEEAQEAIARLRDQD
jgi:hypothetical protein